MKLLISLCIVLVLDFITTSSAFCVEVDHLHPNEIAGYACYKEDQSVICDSNLDVTCTEENCGVQLGGYEEYTCALANFHYEEELVNDYGNSELVSKWRKNCCFEDPAPMTGCLAGEALLEFSGDCTYDKVKTAMLDHGCTEAALFTYLLATNSSDAEAKVEEHCANSFEDYKENSYNFGDIAKAGYQFDREFMNGGSDWNNMFNPDLSRIQWVQDNVLTKKMIEFPRNMYNFDIYESCDSQAVMCCWVADSSDAGDGTCASPEGCQDADPVDNTDVCLVNVENSKLASHTKSGTILYSDDSEGAANCKGFTWTNGETDHTNLYKGNLLFEVALRYGLKDNGYTRSVPHAPMCACAEQMPYVSNSDCTNLEETQPSWSISANPYTGLLKVDLSNANLVFNDCGGEDLATHYESVHSKSLDRLGDCTAAESDVLSSSGIKKNSVTWVKVAGKGEYADSSLSEQLNNGLMTSMNRSEFETVWAQSEYQILLRRCKYCYPQHQFGYYKRYDDNGLPPNVDLLYDVKEHWHFYENQTWGEDFHMFSTFDNALRDIYPWESVNGNFYNVGWARDSNEKGYMYNQWNVWDTALFGSHWGQQHVAFYVAVNSN